MQLCDGLEMIARWEFGGTSLCDILLPPSVKVIDRYALYCCLQLTNVQLCDGLKKIGERAYGGTSLRDILIPSSETAIHETAFKGC